jgi:DNA mismatch repair protein MLH1
MSSKAKLTFSCLDL